MKFLLLLALLAPSALAQSLTLDCNGKYLDGRNVYLSSHPKAPYDRFVRKRCNHQTEALEGDLYVVFDPKGKVFGPCQISDSISEMQLVAKAESAEEVAYTLLMCPKGVECKAKRSLKVNKRSGVAEYFNILDSGLLQTATLACRFSRPTARARR
jgi:hypothetical protein